jgi:uncharacterized protein YkwD
MKSKVKSFQRFTATALVAALLAPASLFAESRPLDQTQLAQIAKQVVGAILQQRQQQPASRPAVRRAPEPSSARRETRRAEPAPRTTRTASAISAQAILDEMNVHRRRHGLGPLSLNGKLSLAASDRVHDMFEQGYFDHVSPDGTQPFVWARHRGYRYATIGENLAEGQRSAREVVNGWMRSPGHRANILGSSFEDCGLAIAQGSPTGRTRGYTFVALYAREARTRARA